MPRTPIFDVCLNSGIAWQLVNAELSDLQETVATAAARAQIVTQLAKLRAPARANWAIRRTRFTNAIVKDWKSSVINLNYGTPSGNMMRCFRRYASN